MVAVEGKATTISKEKKEKGKIPSYLIYETLDGIPVYYKGYREVLGKTKTFEEIMAYGDLQAIFLTYIRNYLQSALGKEYFIIQGETGVHVEHKTNPSLDLCIFLARQISLKNAANKYFEIAPQAVIEVDTKADVQFFEQESGSNYFIKKTKKLLEFGVKEVVWFFTQDEKIMVAHPNQPWLTVDWKDEIEVMGHRFSIEKVIQESEAASE